MAYKRYMIFAWDNYDNAPPLDCIIEDSFDSLEEARDARAETLEDAEFAEIFDRIEGTMVK